LDPVEVPDEAARDLALVILGATGYTGSLMVEHLDAVLSMQPESHRHQWGIAGRNIGKLQNVASNCRTEPRVFHVTDNAQLSHMASKCRVIISAIGPYSVCGEDVVEACVQNSTHYIDVTGELPWMCDIIKKYHDRAKEQRSMIVLSAGNVCAPDEILCYSLVKKLGPLRVYREYFSQFGGISGGTLQSQIAALCSDDESQSKDPFCLGGRTTSNDRPEDLDCDSVQADEMFPFVYLAPAYNSSTGSRVLRRSCALFEQDEGTDMKYGDEVSIIIREGHLHKSAAEQQLQQFSSELPKKEVVEAMLASREKGALPWPGHGPPAETRKLYGAEVIAVAQGESGEWAHARWTSGCAYEVSAVASVSGALVLAEMQAECRGGVLTPAYAFHGTTWIDRIQAVPFANSSQKISVELREGKPSEEALKSQVSERNRRMVMGQEKLLRGAKAWAKPVLCDSAI